MPISCLTHNGAYLPMMEIAVDANALIAWDRMYEVGIGSIDSEHRVLFYAYNTFIKAKFKNQSRLSVGYAMSFLEDYLTYHFRNEENLIVRSNYDRYQEHKEGHDRLKKEFEYLKSQLNQNIEIDDSLLILFKDWVLKHVADDDRDIGTYLRSKERFLTSAEATNLKAKVVVDENIHTSRPRILRNCITDSNGRVFTRHEVSIPGIFVNQVNCENPVTVTNISVGGAKISGIKGMFKEAAGILSIPEFNLPDLSFIVLNSKGDECGVYFTISVEKQVALENFLRSSEFREIEIMDFAPEEGDTDECSEDIDADFSDLGGIAGSHGLG